MRRFSILFSAIITLALASPMSSVIAGGFTQLPRNFGPFEIGMSRDEFIKLTGIRPDSCVICINHERFATMTGQQLSRFDVDGDGADFFFYNNTLYQISIGPKEKDLFMAQQDYETRFGGPGKADKKNGINILKWEDPGTIITLNYRARENEIYSVNLYDWNLKEERDWRESIAQDNAATAALD